MNYGRFTSLGVAMALAAGVGLFAAQPVVAKKKEKPVAEVKEEPAKLTPAFQKAAGPIQLALTAKNWEGAKAAIAAAEPLVALPDDKFYLGVFRLQVGGGLADRAIQTVALKDILASGSPKLKPEDVARYKRALGVWAYDDKDYAGSVTLLTEAEAAGARDGDLYIRLSDAYSRLKKNVESIAAADKAIATATAKGERAPDNWYIVTRQRAYQAGMLPETAEWSRRLVRAYPTADNLHDMPAFYINVARPGDRERFDLFRLMREMKAMKSSAEYVELADLALKLRFPGEAMAVLEEGYAASLINPGSQQAKDLKSTAAGQLAADRASLAASEKLAQNRPTGSVAQNVGDAFLGYGDNAKAITLYMLAKSKGGVDVDELNTHLGIAYLRSGQKAEAVQAFSAVGGARTEIGKFWKTWAEIKP